MTVSVIVPVYNTAQYLPACFDSILAQSFEDFELVVVDDGSTDESPAICDAYAAKDSRIRVFHQQNGGVSAARNLGVEQAKGDWICYVDSDDTVKADYLLHMVNRIEGNECLVMTSIAHDWHDHVITEDIVLHGADVARYLLEHHILVDSGPVAKLFNRAVLQRHNLRFPVGIQCCEDMVYFYTYLNLVDTVVLSREIDYLVRVRGGSLSTRYFPFESEYGCFETCLEQVNRLADRLELSHEEKTRLVWDRKISETFIRSPKCLYAADNHYSWSEKMRLLKRIPTEYYKNFGIGFQPQGFSSAVIKFLIQHRLFTLLLWVGAWYEGKKVKK